MTIESRFTNAVRSQANEVLTASKEAKYTDYPTHVMLDIKIGRGNINTLRQACETGHDLCGKVDARARPEIEAILNKAEKKFAFAERVIESKLKGRIAISDPRLEKMIAKLTQIKQTPFPEEVEKLRQINEKLVKWREKWRKILDENEMGMTDESTQALGLLNVLESQMPTLLMIKLHQSSNVDPNQASFAGSQGRLPAYPTWGEIRIMLAPLSSPPRTVATHEAESKPVVSSVDMPMDVSLLIKIIESLSKRSETDLLEAVRTVAYIEVTDLHIYNLLCSHLYHIQDIQISPELKRGWVGNTDQKLRAAQRVLVEVLLMHVKECVEKNDDVKIRSFFDILEKMNLDPKDLPQAVNSIAHAIHMKLDGKWGPSGSNFSINEIKLKALDELLQLLKATWGT